MTRTKIIALTPAQIERSIYLIRGSKVMIDTDLADLYGVPTSRLNEQVKRNRSRFPKDFMFQLNAAETKTLLSQSAISNESRGGRRSRPFVFTEQGVAMLSSVLNSHRAVQVNIAIIRAFVELRALMATHRELAEKIQAMEQQYDEQFQIVFDAIRELLAPATKSLRIGFIPQP